MTVQLLANLQSALNTLLRVDRGSDAVHFEGDDESPLGSSSQDVLPQRHRELHSIHSALAAHYEAAVPSLFKGAGRDPEVVTHLTSVHYYERRKGGRRGGRLTPAWVDAFGVDVASIV